MWTRYTLPCFLIRCSLTGNREQRMGLNSAWWSCFELRFRLLPKFSLVPFYAILQKDELSTLFLCILSVSIFENQFSSHSRTVGLVGFFVFSSWISLNVFLFFFFGEKKKKKVCLGLHVYPSLSDCLILIKVADHLSSNNLLLLTEAETSRHLWLLRGNGISPKNEKSHSDILNIE